MDQAQGRMKSAITRKGIVAPNIRHRRFSDPASSSTGGSLKTRPRMALQALSQSLGRLRINNLPTAVVDSEPSTSFFSSLLDWLDKGEQQRRFETFRQRACRWFDFPHAYCPDTNPVSFRSRLYRRDSPLEPGKKFSVLNSSS